MHTAFKGRCVVEGVTIQDKVQELIRRELEKDRRRRGRGRNPFDRPADARARVAWNQLYATDQRCTSSTFEKSATHFRERG